MPSLNAFNQFIYTEGNGTPSGVFVANDGVHVYNEQAQVHEELLALVRRGEIRRAMAAEAVARAKVEVAQRGLNATVVQDYYAILAAQRKFVNAQTSLREAEQFLDITQKQEKGGEVAHADVIKAQITLQQRQRDLAGRAAQHRKSANRAGRADLSRFPLRFLGGRRCRSRPLCCRRCRKRRRKPRPPAPICKSAKVSVQQAGYEIDMARYGYLPSLSLDFFYGIDANQFAAERTIRPRNRAAARCRIIRFRTGRIWATRRRRR